MRITFSKIAWDEYVSWQKEDKKMLKKINDLIKDIQRNPFTGIGKPEPLKFDLSGFGPVELIENTTLYIRLSIMIY